MKTYREELLEKMELTRKIRPDAIEIHTPYGCQNGHLVTLVTFYSYGSIAKEYFLPDGDDECMCPKHGFEEGYRPLGKSFIVGG